MSHPESAWNKGRVRQSFPPINVQIIEILANFSASYCMIHSCFIEKLLYAHTKRIRTCVSLSDRTLSLVDRTDQTSADESDWEVSDFKSAAE